MKRRELAIFAAVVALGGVAVWWSSHDGKRTGLPSASTAAKHAADLSEPGRSGGKSWQPAGTLPRTTGDSPTTRDIGRASEAGAPAPETEVEAAVRATFAAYNEHRQPSFLDGWTDRGFTQWFGVPKTAVGPVVVLESDLGPPSYRVGDFANTRVAGPEATTEVDLDEGQERQTRRLSLLKTDDGWRIDGNDKLPAPVSRGASVVDVTAKWYRFEFDSRRIAPGTVVFRVTNTDRSQHQVLLMKKVPESDEERLVGAVGPIEPGGRATLTITDLKPGQYAMLCNMLDMMKLPYSHGMRAEFTVD